MSMKDNFRIKQDGKPVTELILNDEPHKARILLYDIETAPNLAYVWGKWQQDVIDFVDEWYVMSVAWKWLGESKVHVKALNDFESYKTNPMDDTELVKYVHGLFDEADVIIAHNGDSFDQKKMNTRYLIQGTEVPSFYKQVDTLKIARKYFKFNSNKLGDLGIALSLGNKVSTGGFSLWLGCMSGDKKSWNKMKTYNKQDVALLEKVYLRFRPWIENHPAINVIEHRINACPKCGGENLHSRGLRYTKTLTYRRYMCVDCKGWCARRTAEVRIDKMTYVN